jgi:hypothetical protein
MYAFFKLSGAKITCVLNNTELNQQLFEAPKFQLRMLDMAKEHMLDPEKDILFCAFKEDGENILCVGNLNYGLKLTYTEIDALHAFIHDTKSKPKIIAQLV